MCCVYCIIVVHSFVKGQLPEPPFFKNFCLEKNLPPTIMYIVDAFFRQIESFIIFGLTFVFGLQTYYLIHFSKIYQLKGLESGARKQWLNDLI